MMYLQIIWDCDGSIDRYPLSKKSEELINRKDYEAFLDSLEPKLGNIDNHSTWCVDDELPEIRVHKQKV